MTSSQYVIGPGDRRRHRRDLRRHAVARDHRGDLTVAHRRADLELDRRRGQSDRAPLEADVIAPERDAEHARARLLDLDLVGRAARKHDRERPVPRERVVTDRTCELVARGDDSRFVYRHPAVLVVVRHPHDEPTVHDHRVLGGVLELDPAEIVESVEPPVMRDGAVRIAGRAEAVAVGVGAGRVAHQRRARITVVGDGVGVLVASGLVRNVRAAVDLVEDAIRISIQTGRRRRHGTLQCGVGRVRLLESQDLVAARQQQQADDEPPHRFIVAPNRVACGAPHCDEQSPPGGGP